MGWSLRQKVTPHLITVDVSDSPSTFPWSVNDKRKRRWLHLALGIITIIIVVLCFVTPFYLYCVRVRVDRSYGVRVSIKSDHESSEQVEVEEDIIRTETVHPSMTYMDPTNELSGVTNESMMSHFDQILSSLNLAISPCHNFYEYACGNWESNNPPPVTSTGNPIRWGTMGKLQSENYLILKKLLENKNDTTEDQQSEAEKKAKKFYESCIDPKDTRTALGAEPLKSLLQKIDGWSTISGNFSGMNDWNFQTMLQILHNQFDVPTFFRLSVGQDERNSSQNVLQINLGELSLSGKIQNEAIKSFSANRDSLEMSMGEPPNYQLDYMTKVALLLGAQNEIWAREVMRNVQNLEQDLINILDQSVYRMEATNPTYADDLEQRYHVMNLGQLQELCPIIDWTQYFERTLHKTVPQDTSIVVGDPEILETLSQFISSKLVDTFEDKITLKNYMVWQLVEKMVGHLSPDFEQVQNHLMDIAQVPARGFYGETKKWHRCVTATDQTVGFPLGAMFVRQTFSIEERGLVEEILEEVRSAFIANLETLDWMDNVTRQLAAQKATVMRYHIGYPDFILQANQLDQMYEPLSISDEDYFANVLRAIRFGRENVLDKLNRPVDENEWNMTPPTVNAYYNVLDNEIFIPAGILQPPIFDPKLPKSVNYGSIGTVIGHELTHGFDNNGRQFDKNGNLHQWWANKTIDKFNQVIQCMVTEYEFADYEIDGRRSLGENIADNGGLDAAFHAYSRHRHQGQKVVEDTIIIDNKNLTQDQLFFISMAQIWCSNVTPLSFSESTNFDVHAPPYDRVLVPLKNFPEFSDTFKCPVDSPMKMLDQKCTVW